MRFVSVRSVELVHDALIQLSGGSPGLRDRGLLESAVARAKNKWSYEPDSPLSEVAASLTFGLIKNHAFIDGNKRIGLAMLIAFLQVNGYRLTCSQAEETEMVLRVSAGETSEREWAAWVAGNIAPQ